MNKPTFMIAVPKCHENLFRIIKDNHEWLAELKSFKMNDKEEITWSKKINNQQDLTKLEQIIQALRTEKSELFIDDSYHAKPVDMKLEQYIREFLKNKSVGTHYTFRSFYRITVLPDGTSLSAPYNNTLWEQRQEYIIVPLYIILKKGKTYDQMKTLSYNEDGSYNVSRVNPYHFYKIEPDDDEEIERKNREIREKIVNSIN
jgi:hypothetical protein